MNIDVHCHLDQLDETRVKSELKKSQVIGVAVNYESGNKLLEYKEIYPNLEICLGIHPEYVNNYDEYNIVEKQIRDNRSNIVGIGEVGIPYFNILDMESREKEYIIKKSKEIFGKFLNLANELELPLNLHCIDFGGEYAVKELKKYNIKKALFHWFEGSKEVLDEIVKSKWNISISPDVIYNNEYKDFIKKVPLEIITLESDGPWKYNNKIGVPSMVDKTAEFLSSVYLVSKTEILKIANQNARNIFGLKNM